MQHLHLSSLSPPPKKTNKTDSAFQTNRNTDSASLSAVPVITEAEETLGKTHSKTLKIKDLFLRLKCGAAFFSFFFFFVSFLRQTKRGNGVFAAWLRLTQNCQREVGGLMAELQSQNLPLMRDGSVMVSLPWNLKGWTVYSLFFFLCVCVFLQLFIYYTVM